MKVVTEHMHDARACVVRVAGEIDMVTSADVRDAVEGAVGRGCLHVILDLARVTYADSSALGMIVGLDRILEPKGGRLVLAGASRNVSRVLELSGLIDAAPTLSAASDAAQAVAALAPVSDTEPALWDREFVFPARPESLAPGRAEVCSAIEPLGLPEAAMFDVRVAVGEALANAIRHGSPGGHEDSVAATVTAYEDRVRIEVRDTGEGFDGEAPSGEDPYAPSGRGVMFMRALMDRVEFVRLEGGGTMVSMVKHR